LRARDIDNAAAVSVSLALAVYLNRDSENKFHGAWALMEQGGFVASATYTPPPAGMECGYWTGEVAPKTRGSRFNVAYTLL